MHEGVILLWFVLTACALAFVAIDIRSTPNPTVMKWGFVLITAYTGPIGVFLYVLGCREPLPGLHERYAAVRWRQVLGSTMHCVAGDGVLVARRLKHGMTTVRPAPTPATTPAPTAAMPATTQAPAASPKAAPKIALFGMMILSIAVLAAGLALAMWIASMLWMTK